MAASFKFISGTIIFLTPKSLSPKTKGKTPLIPLIVPSKESSPRNA